MICEKCNQGLAKCKCPIAAPWCFYPLGYNRNSAGFGGIVYKKAKAKNTFWNPQSKQAQDSERSS